MFMTFLGHMLPVAAAFADKLWFELVDNLLNALERNEEPDFGVCGTYGSASSFDALAPAFA
jgi:hypothetical protein